MPNAGTNGQAAALLQKSWTFNKRNIGSNICLCCAPVFFCLILAIIQILVNSLFLSDSQFQCGCFCPQCCPSWALSGSPNNYTADRNGTIIITNVAAFGGYSAISKTFAPVQVTNNTDGTVTVQTCFPAGSGACPTDNGYSCLKTDSNTCGIQWSTPQQASYCAVPQPSSWPPLIQAPGTDKRAQPWSPTIENGTSVNQTATLVTSLNSSLTAAVSNNLFYGNISTDQALWARALGPNGLNTGNASNSASGNIYNGYWLSLLGLLFGTDEDPQQSLYIESAFQRGKDLFVMFPVALCVAKNIPTNTSTCLANLLQLYFAGNPAVNQSILAALPPCSAALTSVGISTQLVSTLFLSVYCTENAVSQQPTVSSLENLLYCGFYQSRCPNMSTWINQQYQGGVDLSSSNATSLNLNLYYNQTLVSSLNSNNPPVQRIPGSVNDAVQAWWSAATGSGLNQAMQLLGVGSFPKQSSQLKLDFSSLLGPLFFCWVLQLLLPTYLQQLVYEKEKRLRMMMKMHGLKDPVYWLVTYLWFLVLYIIYVAIFIIFGYLVRLNQFRKTAMGIQIIFYFIFGNNMIAFAFMLSSLFTSAFTAVVVAFIYVFGTGLIGNLLLTTFMDDAKGWLFFVEWVPAWSLYRGLYEMSAYTFRGVYMDTKGMQFDNLHDQGNGMLATWGIMAVEWVIFLVLGLYFEQVIESGTGITRHPLFFMQWMWRKKKPATSEFINGGLPNSTDSERGSANFDGGRNSIDKKMDAMQQQASGAHTTLGVDAQPTVRDVAAEKTRVEGLRDYLDTPIVVKDIKKTYPGLDGGKPKTAVRTMTLGITRGECFGLLGPNGAGKTTTINMLVGFLEPSGGTGIIEGHDIRTEMNDIYKLMGVCPQHDLLWEQLTGREHLRFYGRLKGLSGNVLEEAIDTALKTVNLFNAGVGDKQAGKYSGGMKRRLSVAISFIGDPKVVYLDEPSTGLDPASRRNLWDVVKSSKEGRSIILTTHSMEEAEMLCDRLGIFVDGQLVCIGNPKEITSRYAGFLVFTITVPAAQEAQARQLVTSMAPSAVLTYELGGTLKYELPTSEVTLSQVFAAVNNAKGRLDIIDWGVANATLEEVFIKLAKGIGAQSKDH